MSSAIDRLGASIASDRRPMLVMVGIAVAIHAGIAIMLPTTPPPRPEVSPELVTIELDPPRVTPPVLPPPPPPQPPPPPPAVERPAATVKVARVQRAAPQSARAAQVLTQNDTTAPGVADFATGSAATYGGGVTWSNGASQRVVREITATPGPVAAPAGVAPPGPDRSRAAAMRGDARWACPFPDEATDINNAKVPIRIELDATGKVLHTTVLDDPGHGFAREATLCAAAKPWSAALDHAGAPTRSTLVVVIQFIR